MSPQDNIQDSYPLSPIQEGMLFHSLSAPEADGYLSQLSCRMDGALDLAAFERAWQAVVDRHTALRTAFVWQNVKQPLQVVGRKVGLPLEVLDWRAVPAAEVPAKLDDLLRRDVARGLKLGRAPLMRLTLVRLGERSHHFVWLQHHLILDGWSHALIFREVFELYDAFRRGGEPRLAPAAPFRDYIAWLRRQSLPAAEELWRRKLAGAAAPTPIAVGGPAGAAADGHGVAERRLDAAETAAVEAWAREHRLTASTLVQGAWAELLARYSGEDEVLFGTVVAGRPAGLPGVEGMVGLFINTLPTRVRTGAGELPAAWLRGLQDEQSELRQYEYAPLAGIQKWSGLAPGRPLFESSLSFQNLAIDQALAAAAREVEIGEFRTYDRPPHPLSLVATPGRELTLRLGYDAGRFAAAAVERMLEHLAALLLGFVRQGDRPVSELPLLTEAESEQILVAWNRTAADFPRETTLHRLFERRCAAAPEAPAVVAGGRTLSFRELDARASRLARRLRRLGAGPETRIGLCVERSLPMAVGILGVLKAGAAFVPLDPANPPERLAFLLADCGASLLLTRAHLLAELPATPTVPVLLDGEGECEGAAEPDAAPPPDDAAPENAAYLIYTSGSTGRPKGVLVPHRPVVGYAVEMVRQLGLGPGDRVLQFASLGFDVVIEELFPAWLAGAAVVLHERDLLLDAAEFEAVLAGHGVTGVELPAAFWQVWVQSLDERGARPPSSLRWVIVGSEKPAAERVSAWRRWGVPLIYIFGLTETTVTSTLCRVEPGAGPREDGGDLPIGRPVANARLYVLDRRGSPAPPGVAGELWIGGEGLARGYHGRPDLTADRFRPDPFAEEPGARLYRTGDRVRYRESGELDFLGRVDDQMKVRGFRIEPGEVEAALRSLDGVREAVVAPRPGAAGPRLVAWVVPANGRIDPSWLRGELRRRLPEHMVPAAIVALDALPLTPHGKVDRRALPDPAAWGEAERGYVPPRTEREKLLAGIWSEVLGIERVGAEDNFFELGGDSILTIQVAARALRLGLRLNPRQLFEHPTVAALARLPEEAAPVRAEQGPLTGPVPLLPLQAWFFAQEPAEPWHFNLSLPLELRAPWPAAHVAAALDRLAGHHDALRLRFERAAEGGWEQSCAAPGEGVPFGVVDLSALPEPRRAAAVEAAGARLQASLDLARGPLLRAALFGMEEGGPRLLLLACNHLVVDRVSWEILVGDLALLCDGFGRGESPELPAKTTSVREWAVRLRERAAAAPAAAGPAPVPPLPVDLPGGANTVGSARPVRLALGEEETRALLQEVPRAYRTRIDDVLLTALTLALGDWTGEALALVDLEGHGRDAGVAGVDLSRTVGWLTVLAPVLLDLRSAASPGPALKETKERLRAARGAEGGAPLRQAEVIFNYAGQLDQALPAGAPVALSRLPVGPAQSPRARRSHLLEINAGVSGQRLELAFTFSANLHRPATIERLAEGFRARLRELIAHCRAPGAGGWTPSDFPLARLGQEALDRLLGADREVEDLYPLSPLQEGMLFHALYAPDAGVYMAQMICDLEGEMDAPAFAGAWQEAVDRHPALRTSFHWEGLERPLQKVRARAVLPWTEEDWRGVPEPEREERLAAFLEADRARGFDLSAAPLMRLLLLRTGAASHRLVWSFHQIQMDGWSLPLLFREVLAGYDERRRGRAARARAPQGRPYRDYVAWLAGRDLAQAEAYWRQALAGFSEPVSLGETTSGARRDAGLVLTSEATAGLQALARRCRVTLNTVVQAAWGLLLGRSAGASDVVFGATVSGRPAELDGVESMVGLFINTLPIRVELPEEATLRSWLGALQDRQAEMRLLEWTSLAQIQRWSELPGRSLFDSFLVFQNYPLDRGALAAVAPGLEVAGVASHERSHYPLTLVVRPEAELSLHLAYDPSYVEPAAVARLLGHFRNLFAGLAADPERRLGEVQMLGEGERHQLLVEWNDTGRALDGAPVHRRFEAQARRTPDAVALVAAGESLTYGELDRLASRLARHLRALGVGPEARVGLSVERSAALVAATLAIFKAGGALVPLDPAYPAERLAFLLEETEAAVLLTEEGLLARAPGLAAAAAREGLRVCRLDAESAAIAALSGEPLDDGPEPHHLAYLIFTSGTTGRPKAVQVEHRHLAHTLAACGEELGFGPDDVMPYAAPFSFDISLFESLSPLLAGGTSVVLGREDVLDPGRLAGVVEGATAFHGVPSLLRRLVDFLRGQSRELAGPRRIFVGGDVVHPELLSGLLEVFPQARVVVLYGPTESTIVCSFHRVSRQEEGTPRGLLGRPFDNVKLRVMDHGGRPVPIGVAGELWVGGAGVARGYLRRPELTAELFVNVDGERFYRTGDRVRRLPDGTLEFVGRADEQVKIRGFRVEPGEIEAALAAHPAVRQAVVAPRRGPLGEQRLVAWVVAKEEPAPGATELHRFLEERLPEHMIPAAFVPVAELPLTAHGKVDRRSLPDPDGSRPELEAGFVPPRGAVEERLAALWREVLGVERVGVHDDFFELGGDSILSIQIVARARQAGLRLTPRQVFEHPTIAELAAQAGAATETAAEQGLVIGLAPLTPVQRRFFAQDRPAPHHFNQSLLLAAGRPIAVPALERALRRLLAHHDALRLRFMPGAAAGEWSQELAGETDAPPVPRIDLAGLPAEMRAAGLEAAGGLVQASLDLRRGPLLRAALFDLDAPLGERLLLAAHHLAVDAVSWRILLEDLHAAYEQELRGGPVRLPAKTTSFRQWANALAEHAQSGAVAAEIPYWTAAARREVRPLPVDLTGGANRNASARLVATRLSAEETRSLLSAVPEAYRAQVQDALLTSLARSLARWNGGGPVLVDLEGHGREDFAEGLDPSRTVGWLTTVYPVLLDASPDDSPGASLAAVKEQLRAVPGHGLGYGLLRYLREDGAAGALAELPGAEVGFNYLGRIDPEAGEAPLLRLAREAAGLSQSRAGRRDHLLEVNAQILDGRLEVDWSYSESLHRRETIERLAEGFLAELRGLIAHCLEADAGAFTPADFPLAGLGARELGELLAGLGDPALTRPRSRLLEDLYPLSPMQEGMLFHTLLTPEAYFEQVSARLLGRLDATALRAAWQRAVERHPALRTAVVWQGQDRPVQVVWSRAELPWEEEDWRALASGEREERLADLLRRDREQGVDLARAPLLRLRLIRLEEEVWQLVWSHHHVLLDAWCRSRLFQEVVACYEAFRQGRDLELPRPRPYRDYIAWLQRQDPGRAEELWRRALAGFSGPTPFGVDRTARPVPEGEEPFAKLEVRMPAELAGGLASFARRRQLTENTVLQGAWGLLLARSSGEPDVVFGNVVAGRPAELPGVESIVGLFINTLPVRVRVSPGERAGRWLARLQAEQAEVRQLESTPLSRILRWAGAGPGRPLFESLFVYQNAGLAAAAPAEASFRIAAIDVAERTDYPVTVTAEPGNGLALRIEYDRRRFEPVVARRMLDHLANLLAGLTDPADRPLDSLDLLSAAERHQLLLEWNATATEVPAEATLHGLFAASAARHPGEVAVVAGERRLTYRELDRLTDGLAARLRAAGAGPESRVALCAGHSLALAAGILGILKAGGAYVPLDPAYPPARLSYMLEDSGATLALVEERHAAALPPSRASVILLDEGWEGAAADGEAGPMLSPDGAAYVIYTSGSTGRPKAAVVAHRPLVNFALEMAWRLALGPGDRILQFASPSFDVVIEELFPAWAAGAAVVLHDGGLLSIPELEAAIAAQGVTGLELPAAYWHEWVDDLAAAGRPVPAPLRFLIVGSEKPRPERVARWLGFGPPLVYVFGLTETAVTSSLHVAAPADAIDERACDLPIGRPVANTRFYVLDPDGRPLPAGAAGELLIGGAGIGRGYLGRPALTAERFVPDPFGGPGERLYRTGDRARLRLDGRTDFLGRLDEQVKVRGFRIEPAEVEAALVAHPEVREAVVLAREDAGTGRRLVAYLVPAPGSDLEAAPEVPWEELRSFLAGSLPEHMLPQAFVLLPALPLTPNGKVDRRALPAPEAAAPAGSTAPRDAVEETLARIWSEVLGVATVGVDDDFFALGGDSILSIQVTSRAQRAGLGLTPRQIFEAPTVARLARLVGSTVSAGTAGQGPVTGPVPLTPIQHWFFERQPADPHHFNLPVLLAPAERLEPGPLAGAVRRLLEHHDALRLRFAPGPDGWTQRNEAPDGATPFTHADLSALPAARRTAALEGACAELQGSLDLARGPLLRTALFDLGSGGQRLFLACHHLAVDTVSLRILVEDLAAASRALAAGSEPALPPKTTSFQRWAELLAGWARRPEIEADARHWLGAGVEAVAPLPLDTPGGQDLESAAETLTVELDEEETRALLQQVPRPYRARVDEVLLAALAEAAGAWTGRRALLVDLEGHGRDGAVLDEPGVDLSRTVGWFATLHPVLLDLREAFGPADLVKAAKEQVRAVPRRGASFGLLRHLGAPEVSDRLARLPRAEVLFNYLGQLDQGGGGGDLPFTLAGERVGPAISPRAERTHRLEVNASVTGGRLRASFTYGPGVHRRGTIDGLAAGFLASLRGIMAHCLSAGAGGYTPSDFPLARLDQRGLDRLLEGRRDVEDVYPLAPLQKGMLFHVLLEPEAGQYLGQLVCELHGPLRRTAFRAAWQSVLDRHPALRAGLRWEGLSEPLQVVSERVRLPLEFQDWSGLGEAEREGRLLALLDEDRRRGVSPAAAPPMRLLLARASEGVHQLVWTFLQTSFDGWSLPLLFDEVLTAYEAFVRGERPRLGPAPSYGAFVAWLERQDAGGAEAFWRRYLAGVTEATPLPGALPGARTGEGRAPEGGEYREAQLRLSAAQSAGLLSLARGRGLTLNTLMQGTWALLLARHGGAGAEESVVFGAAVSGRPPELPGVDATVGLFLNTLPVRVRMRPAAGLLAWLAELQKEQAEVRQYEYVPLTDVQRWSAVPAGRPLFETLLVVENYPVAEAVRGQRGALEVRNLRTLEKSSYPLTAVVNPGERLGLTLSWYGAFYDAPRIGRLLGRWEALLAALLAAPEAPVEALWGLPETERHQLLVEWNDSGAVFPALPPVHRQVAEQAARAPEAVAVEAGGRRLTYGELHARATRLAGLLRRRGVGPETLVGVCCERSPELIVGLLGALMAGGAYLPLDPDYPDERLALLLEDSRAPVLVTRAGLLGRLAGYAGEIVLLETLEGAEAPRPGEPDSPGGSLAYAIYTSGSTGRPKGVLIEHAGLANLVQWHRRLYGVEPGDRATLVAAPGFDASVWEIWPYLTAGASLHVPDETVRTTPASLVSWLARESVTLTFLPTPLAEAALQEGWPRDGILRALLTGGDRLHRGAPRDAGFRLVNHYGPTEITVVATCGEVPAAIGPEAPSIGRPIANVQVYVLDGALAPVPLGAVGELYLSGTGLSRGYLNAPALTAERFLPDPLGGGRGARLYRTGDLVRYGEDGRIEFLGRADHQVKVRGFRVELGEVEAALRSLPGVREAAAALREEAPGERRLVGYLVLDDPGEILPASGLRERLRDRLPEYMVPAAFVRLDALPLNHHGKVDRRALPAPAPVESPAEGDFAAPATPVERLLAAICQEVLGVPRVGLHDDFFALGGDSILAIQLVARANQAGIRINAKQVMESPTVAQLAALQGEGSSVLLAEQGEVAGEVPLLPIQHWFFADDPIDPHHANQALLLETRHRLDPRLLAGALGHLLLHHDALRMRFHRTDEGWRQVHAALEEASLVVVDLSAVPEGAQGPALTTASAAVQTSLDLVRGPLLRAVLFDLGGAQPGRLLLVAHHLVVDGVSWRILLEDLESAYERLENGQPVLLRLKTTSYRQWSERLVAHAASGALAGELGYWTGLPWNEVRALPVDAVSGAPDAANTVASESQVEVGLTAEETAVLLQELPKTYGVQIGDVLLTALAQAFHAWTGGALLADIEGHGREQIFKEVELSRTVGWFTTLYPVVLTVADLEDAGAALDRVREELRRIPSRGIGFGVLRYLGREPELAALPRAEVSFNYLGQLDQALPASTPFTLARESAGPARSRRARRRHLIDVTCQVLGGRLGCELTYSPSLHRRETVQAVADGFVAALRGLVARASAVEAPAYAAADFPLMDLSQEELDDLLDDASETLRGRG